MGRILGVTATREGLNKLQLSVAADTLANGDWDELHHGCCIGGDTQLAKLAWALGIPLHAHPPIDKKLVDTWCLDHWSQIYPDKGYHQRNRDIVDASSDLLGCPKQPKDPGFGGTWYTIRYALRQRKLVLINPRVGERVWMECT